MTDKKQLKEDMKWSKKIIKLTDELTILKQQWEKLKKDYEALSDGAYRKNDHDETTRLFKTELVFNDYDCGHVLGDVVCDDLLIAKLVEMSLKKVFADRVSVSTSTKKKLYSDDNEWVYV
jgi:hypothetical protein